MYVVLNFIHFLVMISPFLLFTVIDVHGVRKRFVWCCCCYFSQFIDVLPLKAKHFDDYFVNISLLHKLFLLPSGKITNNICDANQQFQEKSIRNYFWHVQQHHFLISEFSFKFYLLVGKNSTWEWLSSDDWLLKSRWEPFCADMEHGMRNIDEFFSLSG